jgi:DNA-binding transcriptional regulator YiaG
MTFAKILKKVRQELSISQEQFARDLSVSYTTLNRWENERVKPSPLAKRRVLDYCVEKNLNQELIDELSCLK